MILHEEELTLTFSTAHYNYGFSHHYSNFPFFIKAYRYV